MDYRAELERRIWQFHRYLEPMNHRAHEDAHGPCYTIFEIRHPDGDFVGQLREEREPALAAVAAAFGETSGTELGQPELPVLPDEGWRGDGERIRFVQFSFERDWFCMYLPCQTLSFQEAMEILRHRSASSLSHLIESGTSRMKRCGVGSARPRTSALHAIAAYTRIWV